MTLAPGFQEITGCLASQPGSCLELKVSGLDPGPAH